jgi:hypothetical protein
MSGQASWKGRGIREAHENENPGVAAEQAARRFEREAVPIPAALAVEDDAPAWKRKIYRDARELYRDIATLEPEGLRLTSVGTGQAKQQALKLLRTCGLTAERRVPGVDAAGRQRQLVVLHLADSLRTEGVQ